MYQGGFYFRDSYNGSNVLWRFGLSWWNDVIPLLNRESYLLRGAAHDLLGMLKEREPDFEENLAGLTDADQVYFREQYEELREMLGRAVEEDQPILCSL